MKKKVNSVICFVSFHLFLLFLFFFCSGKFQCAARDTRRDRGWLTTTAIRTKRVQATTILAIVWPKILLPHKWLYHRWVIHPYQLWVRLAVVASCKQPLTYWGTQHQMYLCHNYKGRHHKDMCIKIVTYRSWTIQPVLPSFLYYFVNKISDFYYFSFFDNFDFSVFFLKENCFNWINKKNY